jgi:hypothetical protein
MLPPHDQWVGGNSAGPFTSTVDKLLIHTTEGTSISGAIGAYTANNSWPHLTVDCRLGRTPVRCGHLDMDVAARALRNEPGGVQTNTDGVIQIEVVGFATDPAGIDWRWFGANVAAPICASKHIPIESHVNWVAYPASYGTSAPQRLSPAAWTDVKGFVGHQHVPENSHGDPGAIPILSILSAAQPTPPPLPVPKEGPMYLVQFGGDNRWFALIGGKRFWLTEGFPAIWVQAHMQDGAPAYFNGSADNPQPLLWHESIKGAYPPVRPEDGDPPPGN